MPRTSWSIPNSSRDASSTGLALSGGRMWWAAPIVAWADGGIPKLAGRSSKRLLALWNALPDIEKRRKVGDREALIDQLWLAIEALPEPQPEAKGPSKQDAVIAMLRRAEGATIDEVASATGWQRHTVRGVFSGTLKKKLGLTLASAKEERGRVYRIDAPANQ